MKIPIEDKILREAADRGADVFLEVVVEAIHNGYGPFFFLNPFAKALRLWGVKDFSKQIYRAREFYERHGREIERPCSDEDFMGLYEQYPECDDLDDFFMENEEEITTTVAQYLDKHLDNFITITYDKEK